MMTNYYAELSDGMIYGYQPYKEGFTLEDFNQTFGNPFYHYEEPVEAYDWIRQVWEEEDD